MKYLYGNVSYFAPTIIINIIYSTTVVTAMLHVPWNNIFFPMKFILSLFSWCIEVHFICLLFIYMVVCASACTAWCVMCVYTQNFKQYYLMTLKLLSLSSTNQPVRTAITDKTERQYCIECWQNVLIKRYVQRNITCHMGNSAAFC